MRRVACVGPSSSVAATRGLIVQKDQVSDAQEYSPARGLVMTNCAVRYNCSVPSWTSNIYFS